jgi:hypothetical protein
MLYNAAHMHLEDDLDQAGNKWVSYNTKNAFNVSFIFKICGFILLPFNPGHFV